jgi:hypothetical protein
MAPLTYFSAGTIDVPEFFRIVTDRVACGLVLDIGHLWTLYRYTAVRRDKSLEQFVEQFLDTFPLERVVEIHVAGLDEHEAVHTGDADENLPAWIDHHAAPIPPVLWDVLDQVLAHPRLSSLRALALEVDTKSLPLIIEEFQQVSHRFSEAIHDKIAMDAVPTGRNPAEPRSLGEPRSATGDREQLLNDYERYAKIVCGRMEPTGSEWQAVAADAAGLDRYRREYLPNEILHWGGDLSQMFPDTNCTLAQRGIALDDFVTWWFRAGRPIEQPYDFFLLKVARFVEFICELVPDVSLIAEEEAAMLRRGYADANDREQPEPVTELIR